MTNTLLIVAVGLIGGIAIGLQAPLSSMLNQRLGVLESVFIIHLGGVIIASVPLLFLAGGKLNQWQSVPWYALCAGALGVTVVGSTIYMVPRIGVAAAITLITAGQFVIAALIDHHGLLDVETRTFTLQRLLGLSIILVGVWQTLRS